VNNFIVPPDFPQPSGWAVVSLESISNGIFDCPHSTPSFVSSGYSVVRTPDIITGTLDLSKALMVSKETYLERVKRAEPHANDILLSREGTYFGIAAVIPPGTKLCLGQRMVLIRPKNNIDPRFIKYWINSPFMKGHIAGFRDGSVAERLNLPTIRNLPIALPSLPEQRAIAGVLSSLDDKIDLLRRQDKTLEAMAEVLFRQWFIEEADEGWDEGSIADYATHLKESVRPQEHPDSLFEHYSIPAFDAAEWPSSEYGRTIQSNKYKVVKDCLLFSKLNPHRDKRIWLMPSVIENNSICSTEFQVILPRKAEHLFFLYCWLSFKENYNELASGVGGTSGSHQRIDPHSILSFRCPIVPENFINSFNKQVTPLFNQKRNNQLQIRTLTSFRDTLLPKLMSGEVRVDMRANHA
jgi:type I restriction enzyme S subunit